LHRRALGIFLGARPAGNNLSACHELIAERVIAVGVSVDGLPNLARGWDSVTHSLEHLRCERKIE
jgi:hypothetical protein